MTTQLTSSFLETTKQNKTKKRSLPKTNLYKILQVNSTTRITNPCQRIMTNKEKKIWLIMAATLEGHRWRLLSLFLTVSPTVTHHTLFVCPNKHQTKDHDLVKTLISVWSVGPVHTIFYSLVQFKIYINFVSSRKLIDGSQTPFTLSNSLTAMELPFYYKTVSV